MHWIGAQLEIDPICWPAYAAREETRREHLLELRTYLGVKPFGITDYRGALNSATELALQSDKGIVLAGRVLEALRRQHVVIPALEVIERICAEVITQANRRIYAALTDSLSSDHRRRLDDLLKRREEGKSTRLAWLRQSPVKPNSRHMLEHIERLKTWQELDLPAGIERQVHQNRLLKISREGGQMTPADLAKFEPQRRYATLVAVAAEGMATVTDEIIDLHDRIIGKLFNTAKNRHQQQFQASGKAINDKVRLFGASAKHCWMPRKAAPTHRLRSNPLCPGMPSQPVWTRLKSSPNLGISTSYTASVKAMQRCAATHLHSKPFSNCGQHRPPRTYLRPSTCYVP